MSVAFERRTVGRAPALLARPAGARPPLPLVLWYHGLGVDAEVHRPELARVAAAGFLAVGVDAAGHGGRRLPDLDERTSVPQAEAVRLVVRLATETADEVPDLVAALARAGLADPDRAAVAGVSMGAYVAYRAAVVAPGLRAAVAILGSPEWPEGDSPHRHLDALSRVALLSVTAERDVNVPPAAARRLHEALDERFPDAPHRYVELAGAEHLMGAEHWATAMGQTLGWLGRFVGTAPAAA